MDQLPYDRRQPLPSDQQDRAEVPGTPAGAWVVPSAARAVWRRYRADSHAVPRFAWRQWQLTLGIGLIVTLLLTFGLTRVGQTFEDRGLHSWDVQMLLWVVHNGPLTFANAITWQAPGDLLFQPIAVLAFVVAAAWFRRPLIAASMAALYVLAFAFIWTGWGLWNRQRPDIIAGGMAAPGFHSFPSGHAVLTVAIYGFVAYLWVRASHSWLERLLVIGLCCIWTALVGTSRLTLGSHWPSDVLAGGVIGLAWLATIIIALRRAEQRLRAR